HQPVSTCVYVFDNEGGSPSWLFARLCWQDFEFFSSRVQNHCASTRDGSTVAIAMQTIPDRDQQSIVEIEAATHFLHVHVLEFAEPKAAEFPRSFLADQLCEPCLFFLELA
ncbi:MAG: hypothetical protein ACLPSW_30305, partial [Roseiarcus sp.]